MKRLTRHRRTLIAFPALLLCGGVVNGVVEPQSVVGIGLFRVAYSFPPTRQAFLPFYQWSLKEYNGGYLPQATDSYLTKRLAATPDAAEETMIIDFQIHQRSARWGQSTSQAAPEVRHRIIANIMGRLDRMSERDAISAMEFIESLRTGNPLLKGGFEGLRADEGGISAGQRQTFEEAKTRFKAWWAGAPSWQALCSRNPLEGSALKITAAP